MTLTLTIQNADKNLFDALKGVIKLSPKARVTVKKSDDDFFSEANIRHLEEMKTLDDEGKLKFTQHDLIEG
ncbi:MAG: hypothetical protein IJP61_08920 [Treponema sp.]|nr:hypothetical protein [Treponema sp.]